MQQKTEPDEFSNQEIVRRRDDAIRRALNTPPKPNKEYVGKGKRVSPRKRRRVKKAGQ